MLDPFVDGRSGRRRRRRSAIGFAPGARRCRPTSRSPTPRCSRRRLKAPAFEQRWSVWGGAFGGYNRTAAIRRWPAATISPRAGGFAGGLDYRVAPDTVVGFALAGGGTNWGLADGLGSGKSDAFQAGVYGSTRRGRPTSPLPSPTPGMGDDRPLRRRRRSSHRRVQRAELRWPHRGRLSAADAGRRDDAIRGTAGAEFPHAVLYGDRSQQRRLRARLRRAHRDRDAQRARRPLRAGGRSTTPRCSRCAAGSPGRTTG